MPQYTIMDDNTLEWLNQLPCYGLGLIMAFFLYKIWTKNPNK